jgi:hypothetical protein
LPREEELPVTRRRISALLACAVCLAIGSAPAIYAAQHKPHVEHVLLISIDGMHAVDFVNCANGISTVNGGQPYCPSLAALGQTGVSYVQASTSKPSDSFPGLMAIVTGGTPKTVGAYYDVAYDRVLAPPTITTGNGVAGGTCTAGQNNGTRTEYEEGIDLDQSKLNGGAPSGDGGANSIDPMKLPRDPFSSPSPCAPVQPQNFIRTNTVFGVIHAAHGRTAWADKHPAYIAVAGPGNGSTVDDFYGPEINSDSANFVAGPALNITTTPLTLNCGSDKTGLPDQAAVSADDDYTGSFQNIQCYDGLKVRAILNQIDGKTHSGGAVSGKGSKVPEIFGMNFQAVSIGQKLLYKDGLTLPSGYSLNGGYLDANATPSPSLLQEIEFVDNAIGAMVTELKAQKLIDTTLIIVTAKHGQAPIDPARFFPIPGHSGTNGTSPATILDNAGLIPFSEAPSNPTGIGATEDDVSLLWLNSPSDTATAIADLQTDGNAAAAGIGEILSGNALSMVYGTPGVPPNDPRTPDIIVTPNFGVVYTGSTKKDEEHGGFSRDDTNVMTLISNPDFSAATITTPVATAQIAPTILEALKLSPSKLQAVQTEGTQALPGLNL